MDKVKAASIAVEAVNKYQKGQIEDYELIKIICTYFDRVKDEELTQADLKFLKFVSNLIGIPHYYDLLKKIKKDELNIHNYCINTLASDLVETRLYLDETVKVHKYQKQILDLFNKEKQNRYFLSASTSFGKTHLVYDIINKMNYKNVVLIFPTIALLSENLEKIYTNPDYKNLKNKFFIHTLSDISEDKIGDFNIFIFTPERFLSYMDKSKNLVKFDFIFIDEIYKLDNEFIIDNQSKENERDVAYRIATHQSLKNCKDVLLAGPYIEVSKKENLNYNASFDLFLKKNYISKLDYNNYEIVCKSHTILDNEQNTVNIEDGFKIKISNPKDKNVKFLDTIKAIINNNENSLVYCCGPKLAEDYARKIIESDILSDYDNKAYSNFLSHIKNNFSDGWIIYKALQNGVGIHHGLVPKYIQKEIINLFNNGRIKVLLSTTTITEGVNTTAKNLIVLNSSKGRKKLKPFDAKNISGRAGRFLNHFTGRVIILDKEYSEILNTNSEGIKHKNYDKNAIKDDIDIFFTDNEFLSNEDIIKKQNTKEMQLERNLPEILFEQFKAISRTDKITVYDNIKQMNKVDESKINKLISSINCPKLSIDYDGLQAVIANFNSYFYAANFHLYMTYKIYDLFGNFSKTSLLRDFEKVMIQENKDENFKDFIKEIKPNRVVQRKSNQTFEEKIYTFISLNKSAIEEEMQNLSGNTPTDKDIFKGFVGRKIEFDVPTFNRHFKVNIVKELVAGNSKQEPAIQLADLLAGITAYAYEKGNENIIEALINNHLIATAVIPRTAEMQIVNLYPREYEQVLAYW